MYSWIKYSGILLKIFVVLLLSSCADRATENGTRNANTEFSPGELWFDSDSVHINAHGGGILIHEGRYYWFGEHKTAGRKGNQALVGVGCYSSNDLYNWKNEGIVFHVLEDSTSEITRGCVMERPKVIYNKKTGKFVMWFHLELKGQGYNAARTGLAVSNNITGPFEYIRSYRPNAGQWPLNTNIRRDDLPGEDTLEWWTPAWEVAIKDGMLVRKDINGGQMSRDMTLFVDEDGQAYHIHAAEENLTLHISKLTEDYLGFTGEWTRVLPGGHNEAPAIIKQEDSYYMITSGCTGWRPNAARLLRANSIWGPWEYLGNPCKGEDSELTFHSQSTFILPVMGMDDTYIFMADRWKPRNPIDGRYVWLPLEFKDGIPILNWYDSWDLSVFSALQ